MADEARNVETHRDAYNVYKNTSMRRIEYRAALSGSSEHNRGVFRWKSMELFDPSISEEEQTTQQRVTLVVNLNELPIYFC